MLILKEQMMMKLTTIQRLVKMVLEVLMKKKVEVMIVVKKLCINRHLSRIQKRLKIKIKGKISKF